MQNMVLSVLLQNGVAVICALEGDEWIQEFLDLINEWRNTEQDI